MPRVTPGSVAPPPRAPSMPPPSEGPRRPSQSMIAPSIVPLARASAPPSSPIIQSARELELEREVLALREEVARLAVELASVRARVLEESEPEVVRLAVTVAARVVGRELATEPSLVTGWIQDGLAALPGKRRRSSRSPDDRGGRHARLPLATACAASGARASSRRKRRAAARHGLPQGATVVPIGAGERIAAISDALGVDRES
ncbi:MAG: hypothetical protein KIS78_10215 [Labilithrix sp.]|nr:hypothetical protein [Labilithrix sp.]